VIATGKPITPTTIGYDLGSEGSVGSEIAYWGDLILLPHLLNLLSKKIFVARLVFGPTRKPMPDRKQEATLLHAEVSALHQSIL
jgi:hypothetical protein